jgi:ubiquinone biosynthesis protein
VLVNLDDGKLIFLDMGMMGQLSDEHRLAMLDMIWSLHTRDSRNLTRILLQLSTKSREIDEEELVHDIDYMLQRYLVYAEHEPQFSQIANELLNLLFKYGLWMNRSMTIALKSLMQAEELVRTLAPEMSFLDTSVEEVQLVLFDQVDADVMYEKLRDNAIRTAKDVYVRWPTWKRSAQKWVKQIEAGKFTVNLDTSEFNNKIADVNYSLSQSIRQIVLVLLLVGMLLGSAIISTISLENLTFLEFIPQDIFVGIFLLVAAISLFYIISILWMAWHNR